MHQILKKRLSDFCSIRWVENVTGLTDFEDLFAPIVFCIEEMSLNTGHVCNQVTSAKPTSFDKLLNSFDIFSLWLSIDQFFTLLPPPLSAAGSSNRYC